MTIKVIVNGIFLKNLASVVLYNGNYTGTEIVIKELPEGTPISGTHPSDNRCWAEII